MGIFVLGKESSHQPGKRSVFVIFKQKERALILLTGSIAQEGLTWETLQQPFALIDPLLTSSRCSSLSSIVAGRVSGLDFQVEERANLLVLCYQEPFFVSQVFGYWD